MFKSIVVGTDGSSGASQAVLTAAELAATQPESVLHIVTVQKPLSPTAMAAGEMVAAAPVGAEASWEDEIKRELEHTLGPRGGDRRDRRRHPHRDARPVREPGRGALRHGRPPRG